MSDFTVEIGGVALQDFEIPPFIKAGGGQLTAIHKYAGGIRTIDTMGADDDPIHWEGWCEGPNAQSRCQQIDTMRRQGLPITLTWSNYAYLVVIEKFEFEFHRFYHLHYSIVLTVVQDLLNAPPAAAPDVETQMQSDASDAGTDTSTLPNLDNVGLTSTPATTGPFAGSGASSDTAFSASTASGSYQLTPGQTNSQGYTAPGLGDLGAGGSPSIFD